MGLGQLAHLQSVLGLGRLVPDAGEALHISAHFLQHSMKTQSLRLTDYITNCISLVSDTDKSRLRRKDIYLLYSESKNTRI